MMEAMQGILRNSPGYSPARAGVSFSDRVEHARSAKRGLRRKELDAERQPGDEEIIDRVEKVEQRAASSRKIAGEFGRVWEALADLAGRTIAHLERLEARGAALESQGERLEEQSARLERRLEGLSPRAASASAEALARLRVSCPGADGGPSRAALELRVSQLEAEVAELSAGLREMRGDRMGERVLSAASSALSAAAAAETRAHGAHGAAESPGPRSPEAGRVAARDVEALRTEVAALGAAVARYKAEHRSAAIEAAEAAAEARAHAHAELKAVQVAPPRANPPPPRARAARQTSRGRGARRTPPPPTLPFVLIGHAASFTPY